MTYAFNLAGGQINVALLMTVMVDSEGGQANAAKLVT